MIILANKVKVTNSAPVVTVSNRLANTVKVSNKT